MKRLNRDMEAVSPVIATILMVAITVVLAATLYMMVGDIGGDDVQTLTGDITHNEGTEFEVVSISPNPSTADVTITLINETGDNWEATGTGTVTWNFTTDNDEVQAGSRFNVWGLSNDDGTVLTPDNLQNSVAEVVIQVDGVDGTISYEM